MSSRYFVHPLEQQFRDFEHAERMKRLQTSLEALVRRYSKPAVEQKICLSCGARTDNSGSLPCGH